MLESAALNSRGQKPDAALADPSLPVLGKSEVSRQQGGKPDAPVHLVGGRRRENLDPGADATPPSRSRLNWNEPQAL